MFTRLQFIFLSLSIYDINRWQSGINESSQKQINPFSLVAYFNNALNVFFFSFLGCRRFLLLYSTGWHSHSHNLCGRWEWLCSSGRSYSHTTTNSGGHTKGFGLFGHCSSTTPRALIRWTQHIRTRLNINDLENKFCKYFLSHIHWTHPRPHL